MPTVAQPQIFNLPDPSASYATLGQGAGQLGGVLFKALMDYYRRQGGGEYTPATGYGPAQQVSAGKQSTQLAQQAAMGQGQFQPERLGFLGPISVSPQAKERLELQKLQSDIALQQRLPEIYKSIYGGGGGGGQPDYSNLLQGAEAGDADDIAALRALRKRGLL